MIKFYLEGEHLLEKDPNKILAIVFSNIKDIQWWSTECIIEFIRGTYDMLKIYSSERREELEKDKHSDRKEKIKLTKFVKNDINIPSDRDKLIAFYYKTILSNEKMGLLPGFGIESSLGNPEYNSIYGVN